MDAPDKIGHAGKCTAPDSLLAEQPEPALDLVEPRRVGCREVPNRAVLAGVRVAQGLIDGFSNRRVTSGAAGTVYAIAAR